MPDHTACFAASLTWCTPDNLLRSRPMIHPVRMSLVLASRLKCERGTCRCLSHAGESCSYTDIHVRPLPSAHSTKHPIQLRSGNYSATSKSIDSRGVEIKVAQLVEHSYTYVKRETRGSTPGLGQHFSATLVITSGSPMLRAVRVLLHEIRFDSTGPRTHPSLSPPYQGPFQVIQHGNRSRATMIEVNGKRDWVSWDRLKPSYTTPMNFDVYTRYGRQSRQPSRLSM